MAALLWSGSAHAIPFLMVASGGSLLPLLALCLLGLLRNRRGLILVSLLVVVWLWLFPARVEIPQHSYMRTESRIREAIEAERRLVNDLQLQAASQVHAIGAQDLYQTRVLKPIWVRNLEQPLAPGVSLAQVRQHAHDYDAETVFISADAGQRSALASALTGGRWLQGGLASLTTTVQSAYTGAVHDTLPDCAAQACVRIGIHLNEQWIWRGFARLAVAGSLRIEDFLLAPEQALARLAALTEHGKIPAILVFFGSSGESENRLWMAFLQDQGVQNASMLRDYDALYDRDKNPTQVADLMQTIVGDERPELLPDELSRECRASADLVLITSHTEDWERVIQYPQELSDACPRVNLPVEGLLPDEIADYLRAHAAQLAPLRSKRLVGLYLDGLDLFFATQLRDILQAEGYAWSGIAFAYNARRDLLAPLRGVYDSLLRNLYRQWPGTGRQIPLAHLTSASFLILTLPLTGFVWLRARWASRLCFALFVLLAGMVQHAFYRYPLSAWQEPLYVVLGALSLALVMAQWWHGRQTRPLTKAGGLALLRRAGLRVPPGQVLTHPPPSGLQQLIKKWGWPLIFRSNERRFENHTTDTLGEHDSVVVQGEQDVPKLAAAWQRMGAQPGAQPAWLVQPYLKFSASGVIRTGLVRHGQAYLRIESACAPEVVTSNRPGQVQSCLLAVQACLVSSVPLRQQAARIVRHLQGAPALLEFGLIDDQPVWLQCQLLPTDPLLRYGEAEDQGYRRARLQDELDAASASDTPQGLPLLLSLLNASIPGKHWCLQSGQVLERSLPTQVLSVTLARLLPWPAWLWASRRLLKYARHLCLSHNGPGLWLARTLLFLDSLVLHKGRSQRILVDDGASQLPAFASIDSPYAAFGTLGRLVLTPSTLDAPIRADSGLRCSADFLVRERLRCAITCALARVSRQVQGRLRDQGLNAQVFSHLNLHDVQTLFKGKARVAANPALVLANMDCRDAVARTPSPSNGPRYCIDNPAQIPTVLHTIEHQTGVIARARHAWMGLFALAPHVARFEIAAPVHANSHFCQRASLLGIEVVGGALLPET